MTLKQICFFLLIFPAATGITFGESIRKVLPVLTEDHMKELSDGGYLKNNSGKNDIYLYLPNNALADDIKKYYESKKPELFIELVYLLKEPSVGKGNLLLFLFNNIGAVSDQEGLEYISYNRGNKPYPLIVKSWYIQDPDKRNSVIADPVSESLPETETRYVFQKDTTFGGNFYEHFYKTNDKAILLKISNISEMTVKGLVKVADPGEVQMFFLLIPVDEGILCYTTAFIQSPPKYKEIMGYKVDIVGSFEKRVNVIIGWFKDRISVD